MISIKHILNTSFIWESWYMYFVVLETLLLAVNTLRRERNFPFTKKDIIGFYFFDDIPRSIYVMVLIFYYPMVNDSYIKRISTRIV